MLLATAIFVSLAVAVTVPFLVPLLLLLVSVEGREEKCEASLKDSDAFRVNMNSVN